MIVINDPRIVEVNRKFQEDTLTEIRIRVTNIDINIKNLLDAHLEHFQEWREEHASNPNIEGL